ncbi:MAG: tyrosine-type recombinase/integrase [Candidatus Magasanikbacteria bacterium]
MSKNDQNTIKKLIPDFLDYLEIEKNLSDKTQKNYHRSLNKFIDWLENNNYKDLKPNELDNEHIWKYKVYLSRHKSEQTREHLKKTSQNQHLVVLRSLLNFFADRDIESISAEKIKLFQTNDKESINFLDLNQIKQLFSSPDTDKKIGLRDRAILETLFSTGMRVSELVNLDKDQIQNIDKNDDLELSITGKGDKTRTVYLSKRCLKWIKSYLKTQDDESEALFIRYRGPKNSSLRLTTRSIENIVKKHAKKAGLPNYVVPHTLRHSFATNLLRQGVDLRVVQEFLGHKNVSTTEIYTHITNKKLKDVHKEFHGGDELE